MRWNKAGAGTVALAIGAAGLAHADEASDVRALVQEEMRAYAERQKEADAKDNVMRMVWKDGPYLESANREFTLRISMRMHLDSSFTDAPPALEAASPGLGEEFQDQAYLRRMRLGLSGDLTKHVDYQFNIDFADPSDATLKDAYLTLKNLKECLGCWAPSMRVGQSLEPMGLETLTSDNATTFVERAAINVFHPERSLGVNCFDSFWNEHATAALGIFSPDGDDEDNGFGIWDEREGDGGVAATARLTLVPWARDTCHLVHLGASASYRRTGSNPAKLAVMRHRAPPSSPQGRAACDGRHAA